MTCCMYYIFATLRLEKFNYVDAYALPTLPARSSFPLRSALKILPFPLVLGSNISDYD